MFHVLSHRNAQQGAPVDSLRSQLSLVVGSNPETRWIMQVLDVVLPHLVRIEIASARADVPRLAKPILGVAYNVHEHIFAFGIAIVDYNGSDAPRNFVWFVYHDFSSNSELPTIGCTGLRP
jgi:hypothetical protein